MVRSDNVPFGVQIGFLTDDEVQKVRAGDTKEISIRSCEKIVVFTFFRGTLA
jgi:hypothetical protein